MQSARPPKFENLALVTGDKTPQELTDTELLAVLAEFNDELYPNPSLKHVALVMLRECRKEMERQFHYFSQHDSYREEDVDLLNRMKIKLRCKYNKVDIAVNDIFADTSTPDTTKHRLLTTALNTFKTETTEILRKSDLKTESDVSWKPFLKNLLLTLTVVMIIPVLVSMIARLVRGRYFFFDSNILVERVALSEVKGEDKKEDLIRVSPKRD